MNSPILRLALGALLLVSPVLTAVPVGAETVAGTSVTAADLSRILMIPDMIEVMRGEGLDYGASLRDEMFPGRGGDAWGATVALIYDGPTMRSVSRRPLPRR